MGSFNIWQNIHITLVNFVCYWANFQRSKLPKIELTLYPSDHTAHEQLLQE